MVLKKIHQLTMKDIASICDHTFLAEEDAYREKAKGTEKGGVDLWREAFRSFLKETVETELTPYAICVRHNRIAAARDYLNNHGGKDIKIASVVGFPYCQDTELKVMQTRYAIKKGADEIDMVLNYRGMTIAEIPQLDRDVLSVVMAAEKKPVKLILETSELDREQLSLACDVARNAGVDFIKTSTGYSSSGANAEDLMFMKAHFPYGIKISGGVNIDNVQELLYAVSGRINRKIDLDPMMIRIGESSLLKPSDNPAY
jgi:deoxyribose-phosphate aldolase